MTRPTITIRYGRAGNAKPCYSITKNEVTTIWPTSEAAQEWVRMIGSTASLSVIAAACKLAREKGEATI